MAHQPRLSADDWVAAAKDALVANGIGAVKVLPLAAQLGVTRGSFYWHFQSRQSLLDRLLDIWEDTNSGAIIKAATCEGGIVEQYIELMRCWFALDQFDPHLELAVRNWGRTDPQLWDRLRAQDVLRVDTFVKMLSAEVPDPTMALHRARTMYFLQMGWYELQVEVPMEIRIESCPYYFEIFVGRAPSRDERAAMLARVRR